MADRIESTQHKEASQSGSFNQQRQFSGASPVRWRRRQRGTSFQTGLIPSRQTPLQVMHKADKKYEVGKITDEEEAKQRQFKSILNNLTPQNFEKLFEQVKQVTIDNLVTLTGVISQIFDKAPMEPTFCEMYSNFCFHLAAYLPNLKVDNETITFKTLLLNKCQEEFERGEREDEEANKVEEEGENMFTTEEREVKRLQARRRKLGNIRLIGELYKKKMLTARVMHECINKLLGRGQTPDEENILCKLMSTIGEMIDHPKAKEHMDPYFDIMEKLSNSMKLSSSVRFMLKDVIDLRKNRWQQRRKVESPKKIEVHKDAAQERQAQASSLGRAPNMGSSVRWGPPVEFPQQQAVKYSGSRRTMKITHPETHEELRLDGSPGPRSHSNVQPQLHHIPSFPPSQPMNFYPNPYNASSFYFSAASSVPPNSTEVPPTSQPPKFYNQVTMKPDIDPCGEKEVLQPTSSISVGIAQSLKPSKAHMNDSPRPQKEIGPSASSVLPESKPGAGASLTSELPSGSVDVEVNVPSRSVVTFADADGFASKSTTLAEEAINGVVVPDFIKK